VLNGLGEEKKIEEEVQKNKGRGIQDMEIMCIFKVLNTKYRFDYTPTNNARKRTA
jgi:hypothetical protein